MLLLVDDDLLVRVLPRGIGDAVDVVTATSALAAQAVLETCDIDVVATDFILNGATGVGLLDWVRAHRARVGRVLFTGMPNVDDPGWAADCAHAVLAKPFTVAELLAAVTRVARQQR
ncbi:MAG: response regulator [Deltaproteobacteria bacterium]|nr:response regulator [Deltaproteobacteria bacterium]